MNINAIKRFGLLTLCLILSFVATSCGNDEPKQDGEEWEWRPGNDEKDEDDDVLNRHDLERLVKENVDVKCTYKDYMFTFNIKSELKSKLPNYDVQYGIGHSSTDNPDEIQVSIGNNAYRYSSSKRGNEETVTIVIPFWWYYLFVDLNDDIAVESGMYYASFSKLKEMGLSNLEDYEMDLYNSVTKYLNNFQYGAKKYRPTVEIIVDDYYFNVGTFKIP